jgi:hypothetical protein
MQDEHRLEPGLLAGRLVERPDVAAGQGEDPAARRPVDDGRRLAPDAHRVSSSAFSVRRMAAAVVSEPSPTCVRR